MVFSVMVRIAAAIESQAKRVRDERFVVLDVMAWIHMVAESAQ
jgi:hypothetical protein